MMPAQDLPSLPVDGKIQKGVLTSGVTYYIVSNPAVKGLADVALVRRDELPGTETRSQVESLGRFLSRSGVGYRPDGLVSEVDGSTVCRFDDVPVWNASVLDSTLLMSFSYMAASRSDQAIVISGDIDAFTDLLWENLNAENKVSLFVRYIDIQTGEYESRIVNANG